MSATDQERIEDILEFAETITAIVSEGQEKFESNKVSQLALERLIISIGEACSKMSADFQNTHSEIPWRDIIGMRNLLIHAYHRIEISQVWKAASEDIPALVRSISA
jgi:uncharacterized protein with HEPN domain